MSKEAINDFKEVLEKGMVENFKLMGFLTPIMFFYKDGQPIISEIPEEYLASPEAKNKLAQIIRKITRDPNTHVAGIIIEAYGTKIDKENEPDKAKSVLSGEVRISELDEKQDIIVMIFSTPEGEEMISYFVDPETKTVGESFTEGAAEQLAGVFSHFFDWNKN